MENDQRVSFGVPAPGDPEDIAEKEKPEAPLALGFRLRGDEIGGDEGLLPSPAIAGVASSPREINASRRWIERSAARCLGRQSPPCGGHYSVRVAPRRGAIHRTATTDDAAYSGRGDAIALGRLNPWPNDNPFSAKRSVFSSKPPRNGWTTRRRSLARRWRITRSSRSRRSSSCLLAIIGVLFREDPAGAWSKVTEQMSYFLDKSAVQVVTDIAAEASKPGKGTVATIVGIALALFGASGVFGQLQDALNTIWGVKAKPGGGIASFLRARFISFSMLGGVFFLLLVSLTIQAVLKGFSHYVQAALPGGLAIAVTVYLIFDFAIVVLLFAMIFKFLPDAEIQWRDVWVGAVLTTIFFGIGKWALGLVSRERRGGVGLRRGQLAHHAAALDLLFVADPAVRRGVHAGLCEPGRAPREAEQTRDPDRDASGREAEEGLSKCSSVAASCRLETACSRIRGTVRCARKVLPPARGRAGSKTFGSSLPARFAAPAINRSREMMARLCVPRPISPPGSCATTSKTKSFRRGRDS